MAAAERRKGDRVVFERGFAAHMMGIDGTWRRDCVMEDVSETGAKLTVEGSVEGLHLKEFFLLLSSTGLAYRRCELAWVNGDQIGVNFLRPGEKKKKTALIVCRDRKEFWTTQKQFWQWVRDGVITKTHDQPLTGKFLRDHEELMVLVSNTVLNLAHPNHMREALLSRRIGLGGK